MDPTSRVAGDFYVNHPDHMAAGEVALRSINPDASTRQMFPELWKDEHLEPHKPKPLMLETFGVGGTVIGIGDVLPTNVNARRSGPAGDERDKAIRRHASRGDGADHGVHAIAPGRYRRAPHGGAV